MSLAPDPQLHAADTHDLIRVTGPVRNREARTPGPG